MLINSYRYEPTKGHIPIGIYNRGTSYYEVINIPKDLIPMFNKKQIWVSIHTQEKTIAKIRSAIITYTNLAKFQ